MQNGICVLLLTKNEAVSIEKALNSLFGIADQVVIVDTGSTDDTLAIARAHPLQPEVYETVWSDDFSAARNTALSYCRYAWCLFLDADEYIDEACRPLVRHLIEEALTTDPKPLYAPLIDNLNGNLLRNNPRIFAARNTLKYRGRVHEYLSDLSGADVVSLHDILIKHTGYLPAMHDQQQKHQRNLNLLRLQMKEEPDVYRWKYFILRYLSFSSAEALAVLEDFGRLRLPYNQDIEVYAFNAKSRLIHYYLDKGMWEKAYQHASELYAYYKDYDSTIIYVCSSLYFSYEKFQSSIAESEKYLACLSTLEKDVYHHEVTNPALVDRLLIQIERFKQGLAYGWSE